MSCVQNRVAQSKCAENSGDCYYHCFKIWKYNNAKVFHGKYIFKVISPVVFLPLRVQVVTNHPGFTITMSIFCPPPFF